MQVLSVQPGFPLRWRHNDHAGVSNHQPHGCLLHRLFRRRWNKTSKLRVTGFCAGNSPDKGPVTRKMFPFHDVIMPLTWDTNICSAKFGHCITLSLFHNKVILHQVSGLAAGWTWQVRCRARHYSDVIMNATASDIVSLTIVYSTVYPGTDQRKDQSSASLAFVRGIHRWPVNPPHKGSVTRNRLPFDDVIMQDSKRATQASSLFSIYTFNTILISSTSPINLSYSI